MRISNNEEGGSEAKNLDLDGNNNIEDKGCGRRRLSGPGRGQ